ncbi:hypothetical protein [Cardinium endosymbiont of Nabis limbatus]|uniref:hypothetical protein n=1 Tax=Cardinium endosymbiont of Nabis limbatus TaxID=3066217 RepID=UPI003AF3D849
MHIFGYPRLLVWNLLAYFMCVSCSTQVKYGNEKDSFYKNNNRWNQNGEFFTPLDSKTQKSKDKKLKVDAVLPELYCVWWCGKFKDLSKLHTQYPNLLLKEQNLHKWFEHTCIKLPKIKAKKRKPLAILLPKNSPPLDPKVLNSATDDIVDSILKSNKKIKDGSKKVHKKNPSSLLQDLILRFEILLASYEKTTRTEINANLFKDGNNLFHKLLDQINNIDKDKINLKEFNRVLKYNHIKKLLSLKNSTGYTPRRFAIEMYSKKDLDPMTEEKLEIILNIIANEAVMKLSSDDAINSTEAQHLREKLKRKSNLLKTTNLFLKQVALNSKQLSANKAIKETTV